MTAVNFPAIQPTGHEFGEPDFPVTEMRSQSGVRSVRQWGDRASDAPMTLTFANITQAAYAQIKAAHTAARGKVFDVTFPAIVGKNLTDVDLFNPGPGLKWFWVSPPDGNRVQGGRRITCRCTFRAELRL
jgi:hypothetical protein